MAWIPWGDGWPLYGSTYLCFRAPPQWWDVAGYGSFGQCVPSTTFPEPEEASYAALSQLFLPGSTVMGEGGVGGKAASSVCSSVLFSGFNHDEYRPLRLESSFCLCMFCQVKIGMPGQPEDEGHRGRFPQWWWSYRQLQTFVALLCFNPGPSLNVYWPLRWDCCLWPSGLSSGDCILALHCSLMGWVSWERQTASAVLVSVLPSHPSPLLPLIHLPSAVSMFRSLRRVCVLSREFFVTL